MTKTIRKIAFTPRLESKKRVAAYARVSSGKDAMLHSLSAQVSYYNDLIQQEPNWEFVGVYADEAITGTKENRPDFQRLLSDCRDGKVDMVITKSISRFARNTVTLLETVRMLKALGVDVFFEEQNIHTMSADGELMLTILASYAQEESRSASENQKWRVKKNFEGGIPWNGRALGYRMQNGQYCIIPEEAEIVRRIYREYLGGWGPNRIASGLTEDNIPTMMGGSLWQPQTIVKIIRNYSYTGNLLLQTTYCENHITKRMVKNTGQLPRYHAVDTHEAIIPMEQWQAVQAEIERRASESKITPPTQASFFYTGLIQCAKCGKNYRRKTRNGRHFWICATLNTRGKKYCASKQVPEPILDALVKEVVSDPADIKKITADDGNTLHFHLADGSVVTRIWKDRSRAESWTDEKRELARQKALERSKVKWQEQ